MHNTLFVMQYLEERRRWKSLKLYRSDLLWAVSVFDRLFDLVVRVPGYRSRDPGSIPGAARFSEKYWVWNGFHSAYNWEAT
jgi:hypothetical protein